MCGIIGIYNNSNNIIDCLNKLQHRGKDGVGIAMNTETMNIILEKKLGTLEENKEILLDTINKTNPNIVIGHVRYSTRTSNEYTNELQPIMSNKIAIAHNGNIPNVENYKHDTLYILNYIVNNIDTISFHEILINLINSIHSAYSLVLIYDNCLYALRDRYGIRPLCYGKTSNDSYYVSSESIAIEDHVSSICEVKPGQIIKINASGIEGIYNHPHAQQSLCAFELIYFMNPDSRILGTYVRTYRDNLGIILAKKDKHGFSPKEYVVCGVPSSGIVAAESYAKYLKLPYEQFILKTNKTTNGSDRTFILPTQQSRIEAINKKFIFLEEAIKDKNLIIVDDTIVRGNIMKGIIKKLKEYGAKTIHVRIPAPRVIDICQLGIAIHSKEELIAYNKNMNEIKNELNCDSLLYLETSDLDFFPKESYMECFGVHQPSINLSTKYTLDR